MLLQTQSMSSHIIIVYVLSGLCLFSVTMGTLSPLKEGFGLWINTSWRKYPCPRLGQCRDQFYFCIRLRFVGTHLFPIHSCELEITIILCYHNSVRIIFTHLQICNIYLWSCHRHDQICQSTIGFSVQYILFSDFQLCIFSVVVMMAPRWRLQNVFYHSLYLQLNMRIFLVRWSSPQPSEYLVSSLQRLLAGDFWYIMYIFYEVIIINGRHHDKVTTVDCDQYSYWCVIVPVHFHFIVCYENPLLLDRNMTSIK